MQFLASVRFVRGRWRPSNSRPHLPFLNYDTATRVLATLFFLNSGGLRGEGFGGRRKASQMVGTTTGWFGT
jgi:hypothetical protein